MTIAEVKSRHLSLDPSSHFFDRDTLRFFGQTMRSFGVSSIGEDKYELRAAMYRKDDRGKKVYVGMSVWVFNYLDGSIIKGE